MFTRYWQSAFGFGFAHRADSFFLAFRSARRLGFHRPNIIVFTGCRNYFFCFFSARANLFLNSVLSACRRLDDGPLAVLVNMRRLSFTARSRHRKKYAERHDDCRKLFRFSHNLSSVCRSGASHRSLAQPIVLPNTVRLATKKPSRQFSRIRLSSLSPIRLSALTIRYHILRKLSIRLPPPRRQFAISFKKMAFFIKKRAKRADVVLTRQRSLLYAFVIKQNNRGKSL